MTLRTCLVCATAAVALAPAGSVASAQDDVPPAIAPVADPTPLAAHGSELVFSRADGRGGFELVRRTGSGPVRRIPVPSRRVPFDVDLGPTSGGRVFAVYSRCATEPTTSLWGTPEYQTGRGCDIYKVDIARGGETRFTAANSTDGSEFWPTYWKGRLGFARVYDDKRGYPYLYVKTVASGGPSRRVPGGQRNECTPGAGGRTQCSDDRRAVPLALELYGRRLAFAWRFQGNREGPDYDLRIDTVGGGHRRLDHVNGGGLTAIVLGWPSFEGGRLFWSRACFGDRSGCPGRERLVKSSYTGEIVELEADAPANLLSHERADLMTTLLTDGSGVGDCKGDPPAPQGTCAIASTRPDYRPRD
jgi:hypothetical protein